MDPNISKRLTSPGTKADMNKLSIILFKQEHPPEIEYKTLISQEMLKNGFLASNLIYSCIEHNSNVLDQYFDRLESIFSIIKDCEEGRDIDILLEGPICHTGFRRLN